MEIRALAIAFFYAIGTAIGGITGPLVFQKLGESGDPGQVMIAYLIGAAVMAFGGIVEILLGVRAEQRSLEDIAAPLSAEDAEGAEEADESEEDRRRAEEAERRYGARAERERAGLRRYRPGPGWVSYSPFPTPASAADPAWLDREVEIIRAALKEHGELDRAELARRVGAR